MKLIGLDLGTTGCKCTIFDLQGRIMSFSYQEYPMERPRPGYCELNPVLVWQAVQKVLAGAFAKLPASNLAALSISSFGEAVVPLDRQGNVLANSMLCIDSRGGEQCLELEHKLGRETIMELTGIPPHPMYTISKVMWIRENQPELYRQVGKFLLFEDFIIYCLTGKPAIDYSLASRTMAFNIVKKQWEPAIFTAARIEPELFSPPSPSATPVDRIKPALARQLGLPLQTTVVTGGHDQVCAALGAGILKPGLAVDGIGTVECITPTFDRPLRNRQMLRYNFNCAPHAKPGLYATYAFNFTGGSLLKWYRDNFARSEKEEARKTNRNVYARLDSTAPRHPTSLLVLPHFAGAGTPYMEPAAKGAILGLTFEHTPADLYRAMLEGVTYEMAFNLECLQQAEITIDTLRAVGGGAKSDFWLQIKADIMGRKVERLNVDEAGTLGTAIMAGVAVGAHASLESAVEKLVRVKQSFYPNQANQQIYQDNYGRYKQIYAKIRDLMIR